MRQSLFVLILGGCLSLAPERSVLGDGPADNVVASVRRIPPPGLSIPESDRLRLTAGAARLGTEINGLRKALAGQSALLARLPDVAVFQKAVDWALQDDEFFQTNEIAAAQALLDEGLSRATALRAGRTPWLEKTGPVVFGYTSRVDGSVQPYGLVVPDRFPSGSSGPSRLDLWFHGRGEKLSELAFINDRMTKRGEFAPANTFVLHPYGRYCNGARFAGETDAWEALEDVQRIHSIDAERLVVRGFSLGGAACWHFAVHHASRWAAAAPGAGFSETADFLRVFQNEEPRPALWEQKLWRLYDATAHAVNVSMVPLVAYSGETDRQIQAARAMEEAMTKVGLELTHIIGPKTGHSYEPRAKAEISRRVDAAAARGRDPLPRTVRFVTHSLRYPSMAWVTVDALGQHWEPARVHAELTRDGGIHVTTTNVTALTLDIGPGLYPFDTARPPDLRLDQQVLAPQKPGSDRSWRMSFRRDEHGWETGQLLPEDLRKRPGLQGPIDDAFMESFLFVRPTRPALSPAAGAWVARELAHAMEHWRRQFRGDVRIKDDTAVTEADIAAHNLVLWGDPGSNAMLARIADQLPVRWNAEGISLPDANYAPDKFSPVFIYPNPLNRGRYVVVNSSFTFREYDYLNNARQTPKLPDWAIIDITKPVTSRTPGEVVAAGFFGERWEWLKPPL